MTDTPYTKKRAMKNRYCVSFYRNNLCFSLRYTKKCHIRVLCLVSFGGKKVDVLVFISIQNATEKEILKLVFVLVLQ